MVETRHGAIRTVAYSDEDYWRLSKAQIVAAHVARCRPDRWVALDDEDLLWPSEVRRSQVVLTDRCVGLLDGAAQDRLALVLQRNFQR